MSTDRWAVAEQSADLEDGPFDVVRTRDEALATGERDHAGRFVVERLERDGEDGAGIPNYERTGEIERFGGAR